VGTYKAVLEHLDSLRVIELAGAKEAKAQGVMVLVWHHHFIKLLRGELSLECRQLLRHTIRQAFRVSKMQHRQSTRITAKPCRTARCSSDMSSM